MRVIIIIAIIVVLAIVGVSALWLVSTGDRDEAPQEEVEAPSQAQVADTTLWKSAGGGFFYKDLVMHNTPGSLGAEHEPIPEGGQLYVTGLLLSAGTDPMENDTTWFELLMYDRDDSFIGAAKFHATNLSVRNIQEIHVPLAGPSPKFDPSTVESMEVQWAAPPSDKIIHD